MELLNLSSKCSCTVVVVVVYKRVEFSNIPIDHEVVCQRGHFNRAFRFKHSKFVSYRHSSLSDGFWAKLPTLGLGVSSTSFFTKYGLIKVGLGAFFRK